MGLIYYYHTLQKRLVVLTIEWLPWLQETGLFCIRGL